MKMMYEKRRAVLERPMMAFKATAEAKLRAEIRREMRRTRRTSNLANHRKQDQYYRHESGRGDRILRSIRILNNWNARLRRSRETQYIILPVRTEAKAQRDEH